VSVFIGVDPGSRHTGVVVRRGDELVEHQTFERVGPGEIPDRAYLRSVLVALTRLVDTHDALVVVEGVQKPSPFMGASGNVSFSNVSGILGTAVVFGAVVAVLPSVVVPPGGNGSGPLRAYPPELRPTRGKGAGKDKLRHERSAWDVAGAGAGMGRLKAKSA
jgi:hypothetical protein